MAGGEGFEPPLAESESAVLPLDDPPGIVNFLTLGVLRSFTCFVQADFFTFDFTGIAGDVAGFAERAAQFAVVFH